MSSNEIINDTTNNTWTPVTKKSYVPKPKPRCRFGVGCKKGGDACDFEHPECRNGGTCLKNGNGCAFRHPKTSTASAKAVATPAVKTATKPVVNETATSDVKTPTKPILKETWASRLNKPAPQVVQVAPPAPLKRQNSDDASSIQSDSTSGSSVSKKLDLNM